MVVPDGAGSVDGVLSSSVQAGSRIRRPRRMGTRARDGWGTEGRRFVRKGGF
jgi:hypothetical protein